MLRFSRWAVGDEGKRAKGTRVSTETEQAVGVSDGFVDHVGRQR